MAPTVDHINQLEASLPIKAVPKDAGGRKHVEGPWLEDSEDHGRVLNTFRCFIADLCQQFGGGHPGVVQSLCSAMMQKCDGHGCHWHSPLEIRYEVFPQQPGLLQPRPVRPLQRCVSLGYIHRMIITERGPQGMHVCSNMSSCTLQVTSR